MSRAIDANTIENLSSSVRDVVSNNGISILGNPKLFYATLSDYYGNASSTEMDILFKALVKNPENQLLSEFFRCNEKTSRNDLFAISKGLAQRLVSMKIAKEDDAFACMAAIGLGIGRVLGADTGSAQDLLVMFEPKKPNNASSKTSNGSGAKTSAKASGSVSNKATASTASKSSWSTSTNAGGSTAAKSNTGTGAKTNAKTTGGTAAAKSSNATTARPAGATTARPAGTTTARPAGTTTARPAGTTTARPASATAARPAGTTTARPAGGAPPQPVSNISASAGTKATAKQSGSVLRGIIILAVICLVYSLAIKELPSCTSSPSKSSSSPSISITSNTATETTSKDTTSKNTTTTDTSKTQTTTTTTTPTTGRISSYMLPNSDTKKYSRNDIHAFSDYELFVARNEIYARKGYAFQTTFTRDVFNDRSWYKPTITDYDKVNSSLSSTERANTDLILALEKERSSPFTDDTYVKSLNYSSFDTEYILPSSSQIEYSSSTLEKYSSFELFIARNEFYAKKGYDFETSYLDEYFSRRSWYSKKTKNYDQVDGSMSQVERTNINRILEIEKKRNSPYLKDQYVASL